MLGQDEDDRLLALHSLDILDTPPERGFDDVVMLATEVCATPVGLVSLVDRNRQWFKARTGFALCETPIGQSVCAYAIREPELLVIPDLSLDERTRENKLVTQEPKIRFYAGAVLRTPEGHALGTLCVIDRAPRPDGLTKNQTRALLALGRQVVVQIELRRAIAQRQSALDVSRYAQDLLTKDVAARKEADVVQAVINGELSHRLKNIIAMVQAIANQTLRNATDLGTAREALSQRLLALSRAHDILLSGSTEAADLEAILSGCVSVFANKDGRQVQLSGPPVLVGSKAALALALMTHELVTNAVKYGAFSNDQGSVSVDWTISDGAEPELRLLWIETGGPPVGSPGRIGFGSRMIERAISGTIGSKVTLSYDPQGVRCEVSAPLAALRSDT